MDHPFHLDLSIPPSQRPNYIAQLDLSQATPAQLEIAANYLLWAPSTPASPSPANPLPLDPSTPCSMDGTKSTTPTAYVAPKLPLDWTTPALKSRHQAITKLKHKLELIKGNSTRAYYLRRLIRELTIEGGYIAWIEHKPYAPTQPPEPIDLFAHIDLTNPFHIKQILRHYSALRQSPHSWEFMEYFDAVCTRTNLPDWQHHIILRQVDGYNQITTGLELATQFNRPITPSYMSQVKRAIYTSIARTAHLMDLEYANARNPLAWRRCAQCNHTKLLHNYNYYVDNLDRRPYCRECTRKLNRKENENG